MKERRGIQGLLDYSSALSSLVAIAVGLLIGFIIMLISSPSDAVPGFVTLVTRAVRSPKLFGDVLYFATPIIMTGLSVGFAGKTGLFNIGASGQFIVGAYCAILVAVRCGDFLPGPLLLITALLAAAAGGAIWGSIPGILKAWRNVHEVIACIMMNYIGMFLVNYLIRQTIYNRLHNMSILPPNRANLPKMGLDLIFRDGNSISSVTGGIFIAILAAVVIYIILNKTTLGYELKACGYNKNAAQYAGINANRGIVTAMVISGALAGLGGALLYLSGAGKGIDVLDILAPEGFNGIPVALLALHNPIGIIFSALFIGYLTVGGTFMQQNGYAPQTVDMIVAVIIYFSAFSLIVKGYIQKIGKRKKEAGTGGDST